MEKYNTVIVAQICNETSTASQVRPQRVKVGRQYRDPGALYKSLQRTLVK